MRRRRRSGKCEWIMYTSRWSRFRHRLPKWVPGRIRHWRYLHWPFKRTIRCEQFGVYNTGPDNCFDGYNNIRVCGQHLKDVKVSNALDKAMRDGTIDRMLREAEEADG